MVLGARTRFALFRVQIFRGSPLDHENHENITPRKNTHYTVCIYMHNLVLECALETPKCACRNAPLPMIGLVGKFRMFCNEVSLHF